MRNKATLVGLLILIIIIMTVFVIKKYEKNKEIPVTGYNDVDKFVKNNYTKIKLGTVDRNDVYMITVDSSKYIIISSLDGNSIIKHK